LELLRDDAKFTTVLVLPETHRPEPRAPGELFSATERIPSESQPPTAATQPVQVPSLVLGWGLAASSNAVQVVRVDPNTPAAAAALQPGDFITHVERQPVAAPATVYYHLGLRQPGTNVELLVARGGAGFKTFIVLPPTDPAFAGAQVIPGSDPVGFLLVRLAEQQAQIDDLQTKVVLLSQQLQQSAGGANRTSR
jgi:hypothetical protein